MRCIILHVVPLGGHHRSSFCKQRLALRIAKDLLSHERNNQLFQLIVPLLTRRSLHSRLRVRAVCCEGLRGGEIKPVSLYISNLRYNFQLLHNCALLKEHLLTIVSVLFLAQSEVQGLPQNEDTPKVTYSDFYLVEVNFRMVSPQLPSEQLKEIRSRLGITTREVAEFSQKIAEAEGNPEFHISNAWLTQVENSDSVPSIFKLYALSSIYHVKFTDLLLLYGVDLQRLSRNQLAAPLPETHLTNIEVYDQQRTVSFPIRFDRSFDIDNTNLLSRLVEVWGEVPIALIQHLDIRHGLYGYIGLHDMTLYPLLRPGSFVQIDPRVRKIQPMRWRTEFDRPIYFVELRDGYACAWCELQDGHLLLLPHPLSPRAVRRLAHGTDAEIIGQVTSVAMTLVSPLPPAADAAARLPRQV